MLPGHPCNNNGNGGMPPTGQQSVASTPESAQHHYHHHHQRNSSTTASLSDGHDSSLLGSPRSRSQSTNMELLHKMHHPFYANSTVAVAANFMQENNGSPVSEASGGFDGETRTQTSPPPPNRAVGAMRAIRGSCGNPIRPSEPCDFTPIKQPQPQLSDQLKAMLARQSLGDGFGSLLTPLPVPVSTSSVGPALASATPTQLAAAAAAAAAYPWPPFHAYQSSTDVSGYFNSLNRSLREPMWAPPTSSPHGASPSTVHTPGQPMPPSLGRNSTPERSASIGSNSSSLSIHNLTDLIAHINVQERDGSPWQYQQPTNMGDTNRTEWPNVYQTRHGPRTQGPLPMPPMGSSTPSPSSAPPPPPIATSALNTSSSNQSEYAALISAVANFINNGGNSGNVSGANLNVNIGQGDSRGFSTQQPENVDQSPSENQYSIERAARIYRKAATVCDATCTWSGQLPITILAKPAQNSSFSCKVFVGGVPWDITEGALLAAFSPFGQVRVEWPGKEARYAKSPVKPSAKGKGYVYMIYESDRSVKALLDNCARDFSHAGEYYYQLTTKRMRTKEVRQVQIIPWNIGDSNFMRFPSQRLDPKKTVFVGALHGMITAEVLFNVMNDLFSGVVYAGIDTDKYKYPIGSGRVTFNNIRSYHKAIGAAFVEIKSAKFSKKVQIDPYLEDATCSSCSAVPGPYFCRELMCFRYFCKACWHTQHALDIMQSHKPLMRNTRRSGQQTVAAGFNSLPINNGQQF